MLRHLPDSVPSLLDPRFRVPGAPGALRGRALPTTRQELDDRGWTACDILLITGDAYVDHPSFGVALIGRVLDWLGYRVGIIPQPDPDDVEAFRVLGRPQLCWGVTAGNLDSQLARLTIMGKPRRDDAYSPNGEAGHRPANASIVYTARARQAYKGVPVILGGVEASLRRLAFFDFWSDHVRRSLLIDAKADLIAFGMAERTFAEIAYRLREGLPLSGIPGTAEVCASLDGLAPLLELPDFDTVAAPTPEGRRAFARMAREIHLHTAPDTPTHLVQRHAARWVVVHPPSWPLATAELDAVYALPFTRHPHPRYGTARLPAWEMIKDSITTHRGCYAGCSFCAIGAHQGTAVTSRTPESILAEIQHLTEDPAFRGTVSDLGGPSANMYGTGCSTGRLRCPGRSCLHPHPCPNLEADHSPSVRLLRAARKVAGVKHVFVTSGVRFDLALLPAARGYLDALVAHHVGGRLKIAPEHISARVLQAMRKPAPGRYRDFLHQFQACARAQGRPHQVIEYFISGHPGCTLADMVELACYLHRTGTTPEQVQDFYPAPLTLAAAMYYTGLDPLTEAPIYVARTAPEKALQRALLLCHLPAFHAKAREALRAAGRPELIGHGPECLVPADRPASLRPPTGSAPPTPRGRGRRDPRPPRA
jgi:uncharacterized radical SAM protein YgiQ